MRAKSSIPVLGAAQWFPEPESATSEGLVAMGGDLSVERLLLAYRSGIFPWTVSPLTWWSPDPRGIFDLNTFHVPASLAKIIKKQPFRITMDRACRQVIESCARAKPGRESTWISAEFIDAYTRMHLAGYAHSVECWQDGRLVGGIYGVALGGLFAGESMFYEVSNASKVALCYLVEHLMKQGFSLFDIQMITPATRQLGATEISRREYLRRLGLALERRGSF